MGIKNLTINEPFFQGHFPDNPVMPGVLQLEALAQTAGILLNKLSGRDGKIALFTSIDNARFRRMLVPGDTIRMEAEIVRARSRLAKVHGKIFVDEQLATEADLSFSFL